MLSVSRSIGKLTVGSLSSVPKPASKMRGSLVELSSLSSHSGQSSKSQCFIPGTFSISNSATCSVLLFLNCAQTVCAASPIT